MEHDPALDAHEHSEHAAHAALAHDPFVSRVSITIALLATVAAAAGSLESVESGSAITASSEAALMQDRATDSWTEFQADSLKRNIYSIAADGDAKNRDAYRHTSYQENNKQKAARVMAQRYEAERNRLRLDSNRHEHRHHWLTGAATITEIGIAISTVAIITKRRTLWLGAMLLGSVGFALFAAAYLT